MFKDEQLPTTIEELVDWLQEAYPETQTITTRELSSFEQGEIVGKYLLIQKIKEIITKEE